MHFEFDNPGLSLALQPWAEISERLRRNFKLNRYLRSANAIISRMLDDSRGEQITVRVIRDGLPEPPDDDWMMASPEERIEAVWMLTKLCLAWNNLSTSETRLQRTVTRLQRAEK